ncbi:unnamed protein product [Ascophyllum nodosum]
MNYYCNGARCNGKRIGRGRYIYYAAGSNQWHWCSVSFDPSIHVSPLAPHPSCYRNNFITLRALAEI